MKRVVLKMNFVKLIILSGLVLIPASVFILLKNNNVQAGEKSKSLRHFSQPSASNIPVEIERSGSPWIKLKQGEPLNADFVGTDSAISRLESGSPRPTALAAVDFNFDGYMDVIGGFSGESGGVLTFHRASKEAFAPEDPQVLAGIRNGEFPVSFEKETKVIEIPVEPDFIVSGRFVKDSPLDLVIASRNSNKIYVFSTDERGGFKPAREIVLDETVTALAGDRFNELKEFSGLTVGTKANGGDLLIFDGSRDIFSTKPQITNLGREINSLILASADGATVERDLFILAGGEISRIPLIGKGALNISKIDLPVPASDFAIGEFIRDRRAKAEIAILGENGSIYYLQNGSLDLRPFTEQEMRAHFAKYGRGKVLMTDSLDEQSSFANNWTVAEEHNLGVFESSRQTAQPLIQKAYITGNATEDLLVANPSSGKVQVIFKEPNYEPNATSFTGATLVETVDFAGSTAAVLPVRLNVMGQKGIVALENGKLEPTPVMLAPNATFNVTTTTDENNGACSGAGTGCSVREAINAANGAAGSDMVTFTPNGTHQLTVGAANENSGGGGDLDVTQALTITGNGAANTIMQGGASLATGIDKVLSINPTFTVPFATSITGATIRFGRNPSGAGGDGYGGAFDWDGSGTGTLTVSNVTATDNRTTDGLGGGVAVTQAVAGGGGATFTGTTFSNNLATLAGVSTSPLGGGLFVGTNTFFALNNVTFSGNSVNNANGNGDGGGLRAESPSGSAGTSTVTNVTFSNNSARRGGGIATLQALIFTAPLTFSGNSATQEGGAIFSGVSGTTSISKATFTGNSAVTNGGAISNQSTFLSVSFSRFNGNTGGGFTGIVSTAAITAQNNWWSCNTGPSAGPCNTAGGSGAGSVNFTPWLVLGISAAQTTVLTGQNTLLTGTFLTNSGGGAVSASNLDVIIGLPVTWGGSGATISSPQTTVQNSGTMTANFSAATAGAKTGTVTVDGATATVNITATDTGTWDGSTSNDWNNATNWTPEFVPMATNNATLPSSGVTNEATLSSSASVANLTINSGRTLRVNNSLTVSGTLTNNGTIGGTGTIVNNFTNGASGIVAPGLSPGILNITGNYTNAGAYNVEIGGTGGAGVNPNGHDQLLITGTATVGGTLNVTLTNGFTPVPGNQFVILDAATSSGTFATTNLPNIAPNQWALGYDNANGRVILGVVPATAAAVSISGRILSPEGSGINRARVSITDASGAIRTVQTNSFGYYRIEGVAAGQTYTISATAKGYQFTPRVLTVSQDVIDLDIIAIE